jgi:hypothetical protein
VKVPRAALTRDETSMLYFDVTGEPVPPWTVGVAPDDDVLDPPTPDE